MGSLVIEKKTLLAAPLARVWEAISDSEEFGRWFGVRFDGPFVQGQTLRGAITPTTVDAEIAAAQEPHAGKAFTIMVEVVEPQSRFAFRWHPFAIEPGVDYTSEPMTLVEFELTEEGDGVLLTVTESGFELIPEHRRAAAFQANDGGWAAQMGLITKFLQDQLE